MEGTRGAFDYYNTLDSIDHETMRMLKEYSVDNPELLKDIFDSFEPEAEELIEKLKLTMEERDFEGLRSAAHAMAGICGSVGALRLRKISMDIELKIKSGSNEEAIAIAKYIYPAYNEYKTLITNL